MLENPLLPLEQARVQQRGHEQLCWQHRGAGAEG